MQQSVPNLALRQLAALECLRIAWASWKPCEECAPNCLDCVGSDEDVYPTACQCCVNHNNYKPRFKYCSECGRPLTEDACVELAKHIRAFDMGIWVSVEDCLPEESQEVKKFSEPDFEMCSVIACGKMVGGCGQIVKETNRIVYHKTKDEFTNRVIVNGGHEFDKWYWADGWECVTHWMPLPRLPVRMSPDILARKG